MGLSIGASILGVVSALLLFFLPSPFNLIVGIIGLVASVGLSIGAMVKNNKQAKERIQPVVNNEKTKNHSQQQNLENQPSKAQN